MLRLRPAPCRLARRRHFLVRPADLVAGERLVLQLVVTQRAARTKAVELRLVDVARPGRKRGSAGGSGTPRADSSGWARRPGASRAPQAAELRGRTARPRAARRCRDAPARRKALAVGDLGDLAQVHHEHTVRDVADDVEVVRDEDVREPEVALQVLEQVEDLRLHRDVQRRDGLVADDELRVDRERAGDTDPLPLPAGKLVRKRLSAPGSVQRGRALPGRDVDLGRGPDSCTCSGSATMKPTACAVQARERILKTSSVAADRPYLRPVQAGRLCRRT